MSEQEIERVSPEPSCFAVQIPTQDVNQTESEFWEDADDAEYKQEIKVELCTSTDMTLQKENSETLEQETQDDVNPHGSERNKIISSKDVGNSTATVKVLLMPERHMITVAFTIGLTILDLKKQFAFELRVPSDIIQITLDDKSVDDHQTLLDIGVQQHGMVQFEMSSLDPENYPMRPVKPQQEYNMPDVITVRVQTDTDAYQDVVVEIERATRGKAFLGGHRHKVTKAEYYHAAVQTRPKKRPDRGIETFCRDTQTVQLKNQAQQCSKNASTQMTKIGCYVSNMEDKLITPGTYITAEEYHSKRLRAVITLQTYVRRWLAKRFTDSLRQAKELRLAWLENEKRRKKEKKEQQIRDEYHRRMNPEKKGDFDLLYNALKKWRIEEVECINGTFSGAERKAALCALLEQETHFISSIERHRIAVGERNQDKAIQAFLNKSAEPKRWRAFDGKVTEMDTQFTIRAKELRDLYSSITQAQFTRDERLDVLLTLKHTVKEHKCKLTQDIVDLIDREADLLMRGVKKSNLEGLRKRISTLFLQYIKMPAFNPQVSKLLRVPQDPADFRKNICLCRGCNKYQSSTEFALMANASLVSLCRRCTELDNEARRREDFTLYKNILKRLRETEAECSPNAKITFLLQEQDLRYLVDVLWGAQSALSGWNDLHDLLLVRWEKYLDWSPWNCILLTKDEAAAHLRVENIEKAYDVVVIHNVKQKHALARKYFSQIPAMAECLRDAEIQPAALGNLLVSKPITKTTE
ncbi:IQ and ubiquitin-like domain-containing protein isoform X1 [Myxocyprinus asiaticus]|uniref:IQ and ubiquitin-like domain-containing protein isoform X1 n=1 Tax=Myxocyprinus asiaticus TaxID=70543 RepID=UPI0022224BDD|nr:IQ and ubiquitin-like domain-containing protein isoform X1 [Myxocyprinus asiaticus]